MWDLYPICLCSNCDFFTFFFFLFIIFILAVLGLHCGAQVSLASSLSSLESYTIPSLKLNFSYIYSVQLLSRVWLFATPWTAAPQASLSITNSQSSLRLTSIKSMMPSSHLILCLPLLLLPSIFPSIRIFFQWGSSLHQVAKVLGYQLQHQSFRHIFRTDFL